MVCEGFLLPWESTCVLHQWASQCPSKAPGPPQHTNSSRHPDVYSLPPSPLLYLRCTPKCPVGNPLTLGLECLVLKSQLNSTYCAPTTCQAALGSSRYQEHQLTALPSRNLLVSGINRQTNRPITHLNICNDTGKLQALEEGSLEEVASEMSLK